MDALELKKSLEVMASFTCEHQRWGSVGDHRRQKAPERKSCERNSRGGICNSCWARQFAEGALARIERDRR